MTCSANSLIDLGTIAEVADRIGWNYSTVVAAGSTIADATFISTKLCIITGADGTKGAKIRRAAIGELMVVRNAGSSSLLLYPVDATDSYNSGAAGAAYTILAGGAAVVIRNSDTDSILINSLSLSDEGGAIVEDLELSTANYNDISMDVSNVTLPTSGAPTWVAYGGVTYLLAFSGTASNTIYFTAQLPHGYKENNDIEFHIHTIAEDDTAGNVRWEFSYRWGNVGETFGGTTTIQTLIATPEESNWHQLGHIADIAQSGKEISSILLCALTRTGAHADDTYNSKDIYLISADFHIKTDTLGSDSLLAK